MSAGYSPPFLQSRLLDELVSHDVSGVMYDVRDIDPDDFNALQPLAKLKIHAKKRIVIIPIVKDESCKGCVNYAEECGRQEDEKS